MQDVQSVHTIDNTSLHHEEFDVHHKSLLTHDPNDTLASKLDLTMRMEFYDQMESWEVDNNTRDQNIRIENYANQSMKDETQPSDTDHQQSVDHVETSSGWLT